MKHFWKCFHNIEYDIDWGFEAVRVDRPTDISLKHVELCYAEISHISVLVAYVISVHMKFDILKMLTLLPTQQACGYVVWV
jgi:hypothetical protein